MNSDVIFEIPKIIQMRKRIDYELIFNIKNNTELRLSTPKFFKYQDKITCMKKLELNIFNGEKELIKKFGKFEGDQIVF
jgi:hypothetical protein